MLDQVKLIIDVVLKYQPWLLRCITKRQFRCLYFRFTHTKPGETTEDTGEHEGREGRRQTSRSSGFPLCSFVPSLWFHPGVWVLRSWLTRTNIRRASEQRRRCPALSDCSTRLRSIHWERVHRCRVRDQSARQQGEVDRR